ncbi:MAG TPA: DNA-3-methyladenine glycosylase I [Acidimicrobiales bacterium]|nr:DNA-3-methyladenine glycosylase I [Acidimicrobiales bacterium]
MRCFGDGDPLYEAYHDHEWGHPVTDEEGLFERLVLESFQSGLAWITILRKRDAFRSAFAGFDIDAVAAFGDDDVERLLSDAGIVRNRAKIEAAIANARATCALHEAGGSLRELLWTDEEPAVVAKRMKSLGFRFLGPTTVESAMQACGVVDGHGADCPWRGGR